ncbi:MAG: ABC transporter permease, partial [Treponema sp.]|nr:ABC transporter permease [Treponema sp.]
MNLIQLLQTCFRSILRNRMRSLLTSLGVIIGVGSVIIMVAIGEGSQKQIEARITAIGTNILQVQPRRSMSRSGQQVMMRQSSFSRKDIEKLRTESTYAAAITGIVSTSQNAVGPEGNAQVQINGVEPDFFIIRSWDVELGMYFDEEDLLYRNTVAVLGSTTAASLFGEADEAIGQQIRIGTNYFTVIGVLQSKGAGMMGGGDQDDIIVIPLDTVQYRLVNSRNIASIMI